MSRMSLPTFVAGAEVEVRREPTSAGESPEVMRLSVSHPDCGVAVYLTPDECRRLAAELARTADEMKEAS